MSRIRTIKPEFPQSQSMGRVSRDARLLFILLWTLADDSGRTRAASRMLASLLYPYDDDAPKLISGWLAELSGVGAVVLYSVDGDDYLEICNWLKHQKIDKPSKSKFPPFDESSRILASPREHSSGDRRTKDQGPEDQGPQPPAGGGDQVPTKKTVPPKPDDVSQQVWDDWLVHRKSFKAPVTVTVLKDFRREAAKANLDLEGAIVASCRMGWRGFEASWMEKRGRSGVGVIDQRKMDYTPGTDESNGWEAAK